MKFIFGIKVAMIGMAVVFSVLILLVVFIKLMGYLIALYEKRKALAKTDDVLSKPSIALAESVNQLKDRDEADEDEVSVAICAALAAHSRNQ